jgi:hypothetical protein
VRAEFEDAAYGGHLTPAQVLYRKKDGEIGPTLFGHMVAQGRSARRAAERAEQAQAALDAKIGARDMAGAYAARQGSVNTAGANDAGALYAQDSATGKTFSRKRVLDIIMGEKARWHQRGTDLDKGAMLAFDDLLTIFQGLE